MNAKIASDILSRPVALGACLLLVGLQPAAVFAGNPNLIVNGTFNEPGAGCAAGTTSVPGWTVSSGNVDFEDVTCSGLAAPSVETYFLDLTGSHADGASDVGVISQAITTEVGQAYRLSFYFGGNPQWQEFSLPNDSQLKAMAVFLNGSIVGVYSVATAGVSSTDPQWHRRFIEFTATSTSTTVTFESLNGSATNPSDFGPLLGDVIVTAIKTD